MKVDGGAVARVQRPMTCLAPQHQCAVQGGQSCLFTTVQLSSYWEKEAGRDLRGHVYVPYLALTCLVSISCDRMSSKRDRKSVV